MAHRVDKAIKIGVDLGERAQNQADAANAIKNPNSQSAATGGSKGPKKPEDPEEKEKKEKEADPQSAASAQKLKQKLAEEQQLNENGIITHRGGNDSTRSDYFRDAEKFAQQYGGKVEEWVKKSRTSFDTSSNSLIQTHWTENLVTGQRLTTKVKEIFINAAKNA